MSIEKKKNAFRQIKKGLIEASNGKHEITKVYFDENGNVIKIERK